MSRPIDTEDEFPIIPRDEEAPRESKPNEDYLATIMEVDIAVPHAEQAASGVPSLEVSEGSLAGRRIELRGSEMTIGRNPGCDLVVDATADVLVSGRHARLLQEGASLLIEDLGSTNGTFVDGRRIDGRCVLKRGNEICLGRGPDRKSVRGALTFRIAGGPVASGPGRADLDTDPPERETGGVWSAIKNRVRDVKERIDLGGERRELLQCIDRLESEHARDIRILGATIRNGELEALPEGEAKNRLTEARREQADILAERSSLEESGRREETSANEALSRLSQEIASAAEVLELARSARSKAGDAADQARETFRARSHRDASLLGRIQGFLDSPVLRDPEDLQSHRAARDEVRALIQELLGEWTQDEDVLDVDFVALEKRRAELASAHARAESGDRELRDLENARSEEQSRLDSARDARNLSMRQMDVRLATIEQGLADLEPALGALALDGNDPTLKAMSVWQAADHSRRKLHQARQELSAIDDRLGRTS